MLVEERRKSVAPFRHPPVCRVVSALLYTSNATIFYRSMVRCKRDLIGECRFVMPVVRSSANRNISIQGDPFLLPAMWRRLPSTTAAACGHAANRSSNNSVEMMWSDFDSGLRLRIAKEHT